VADLEGYKVSTEPPFENMCTPHSINMGDALLLVDAGKVVQRVAKCWFNFRNTESTSINFKDLFFGLSFQNGNLL